MVNLKQRTYLDDQGRAVCADDPSRQTLLGPEGRDIPQSQADACGLVDGAIKRDKRTRKDKRHKQRVNDKSGS